MLPSDVSVSDAARTGKWSVAALKWLCGGVDCVPVRAGSTQLEAAYDDDVKVLNFAVAVRCVVAMVGSVPGVARLVQSAALPGARSHAIAHLAAV